MNNAFLNKITEEIRKIPQKVTLVAVTKSVDIDETNEVIRAGARAIGENRVEYFEKKFPHILPVEKHFIGQIQSRKIKRIVELFDVIQSVGSIKHLQKIENEASVQGKSLQIFLQFNISGEGRKSGFRPDEFGRITIANDSLSVNSHAAPARSFMRRRELTDKERAIATVRHVKIIGVMGMATDTKDAEVVRKQFRLLKTIRDRLHTGFPEITELSMGMSHDYKIALEEGATMVRIGRALFDDTMAV